MLWFSIVVYPQKPFRTFRGYNYSLSIGNKYGLGAFTLNPYRILEPNASFELSLSKIFSIVGSQQIQFERKKIDLIVPLNLLPLSDESTSGNVLHATTYNTYNSFQNLNFRIYTTGVGYISPFGRYLSYGLFRSRTVIEDLNPEISYTIYGKERTATIMKKMKNTLYGINVAIGHKNYYDKHVSRFREVEFGVNACFSTNVLRFKEKNSGSPIDYPNITFLSRYYWNNIVYLKFNYGISR